MALSLTIIFGLPHAARSQWSARDSGARERGVGDKQEALPRAIIDHHQDAEATPVDQLIGQEVERSAFTWKLR